MANFDGIMGVLASVEGDTLTIELVDMPDMGDQPEGRPDGSGSPDGDMPDRSDMPEGGFPDGSGPPDGSMPEGGPGGGRSMPEGGFGGGFGNLETTGETMEVAIGSGAAITLMGGEALATADLQAGDVLQITLADDGATAASIVVMRQAAGESNP